MPQAPAWPGDRRRQRERMFREEFERRRIQLRGVRLVDDFVEMECLPMLLPQEEAVGIFIISLTSQLSEWFEEGKLQRIVLVIMSKAAGKVLERWKWNFNIVTDGEVVEKGVIKEKSYTELLCAMVLAECVYKVDRGPPTLCKFSLLLSYEELYCSNFTI